MHSLNHMTLTVNMNRDGLIIKNDESAYRESAYLSLKMNKTKEMGVDLVDQILGVH